VGQAGVLGAADPVLDAGVGAVAGLEVGELTGGGVGGEGLEAPAVGVGEGELRSGMWSFPRRTRTRVPSGQPAAVRLPSQPVSSATSAPSRSSPSASIAWVQACLGSARIAACTAAVMVNPTENRRSRPCWSRIRRRWASQGLVAPAPSAQTRIGVPCRWASGIWASATSVTVMWSAAVLDPALPGRSRVASASPVLSHQAVNGWKP